MLLFCYFSCSHQNQGSDLQQGGEVVHELLFYYIIFLKGRKMKVLRLKVKYYPPSNIIFIFHFFVFGGVKKFKSSVKSNKKIDK